jgi:hypothetical protein
MINKYLFTVKMNTSNPNGDLCGDTLTCPNGNCIGCRDGSPWCEDPLCQPYCGGCSMTAGADTLGNMVTGIILICLVVILFIFWFMYGPALFRPHNDMGEPIYLNGIH